jgi:hypothetical protein
MVLGFRGYDDNTTLDGPDFGISNIAHDTPSGQYDPRNTKISFEGDQLVVYTPDGSKRIYGKQGSNYYLQKAVLPNGKVLRFYSNR